MKVEGEKRFALLLAARDSEYVKKMYGGYSNVFVAAFGEEGERWDLFRVVEGEFPDMNELQNYDGFVVSGSPYDAYANHFWILKLCFLLQTLDAMGKKYLVFASVTRALGGKVGKAANGWDIGLRKVWEVPIGAEVIAFSEKTGVEMFIIEDHILGIQGHPEYTKDILNNLMDRLVTNDSIEKSFGEEAKSKLQMTEPDRKCGEKICKSFLKGR